VPGAREANGAVGGIELEEDDGGEVALAELLDERVCLP
jgi:hypothetical protein